MANANPLVALLAAASLAGATVAAGQAHPGDAAASGPALLLTEYRVVGETGLQVLGKPVSVRYVGGMGQADRERFATAFREAARLIDAAGDAFTATEALAIRRIERIYVTDVPTVCLGQTGPHDMTLSTQYLEASSAAWLGSLVAHEGQHAVNDNRYQGEERWKDEQTASQVQLSVGEKIGFTPEEVAYLKGWGSNDNKATTQGHMRSCFTMGPAEG